MSSLERISAVAVASLFAAVACTLLAPDDDDYIRDDVAQDGAPANPDRTLEVPPDSTQDDRFADTADHVSPSDAAGDSVADRADGAAGTDGADGTDGTGTDAADAEDAPCTSTTQCGPGRFCTVQGRCRLCNDPSTLRNVANLEFGTPEPLTVINDAAGLTHIHHPRAIGKTGLIYSRDLFGSLMVLTPDMMTTPGAALPAPIDIPVFSERAGLSFQPPGGPLAAYTFFYSAEVERGDKTPYELFGATLDEGGIPRAVGRLAAPFNSVLPAVQWNSGLALSQDRAVWVRSEGDLLVQMFTARLENPMPTVLEAPDAHGCFLNQLDWSPWLAPSGRLLFYNAIERDADCKGASQYPGDIYVVELNAAGEAVEAAVPLKGISKPGTDELDGSLSPDHCWLYYSYGTPEGLRAARAPRVH